MDEQELLDQIDFEDSLWIHYQEQVVKNDNPVQHIDPIMDELMKDFGFKHKSDYEVFFQRLVQRAVKRESKYQVMLEVDMTWREYAAFFRRKPENQIRFLDRGGYIRIIQMEQRNV